MTIELPPPPKQPASQEELEQWLHRLWFFINGTTSDTLDSTITAHIADLANPHQTTKDQVLSGDLIDNGDIAATAGISGTKIDPDFGAQNVITTGTVTGSNITGANTGDQTITLSGDVSGSGTGAITVAIEPGVIVDADINASAAIAYSKLDLAGSIVNADINASAAIAYSKLDLTGNIVNADINASAAIVYSKLDLTGGIVNADVNASAAIAGTKIDPDFGSQAVDTTGALSCGALTATGLTHNITQSASNGQLLLDIENANTGASASTRIRVGSSAAADAWIHFITNNANTWSIGLDHSQDAFTICEATTLGSNEYFRVDAGDVFFPNHGTTASAANAFLDSGTGEILRSTSSERYKNNIRPSGIETEVLAELEVVDFEDKKTGETHFGLIAEDVAIYFPELVEYIPESKAIRGGCPGKMIPDGVRYDRLSVLLLKELQERGVI